MKDIDVVDFENYSKAKRKALLKNDLKEVANLCNALGDILARQGKFHDALEEHQQELSACEGTQDVIGVAVARRKIGECYSELGNYEEALCHQKKYLELAHAVDNIVEEQRAYATIGRTFLFQAEPLVQNNSPAADDYLDQAEDAFMKSLGICSRLKEKVSQKELMEMKSRLYLNLGLVCENKGNVKQCSDLIKQAIHINVTHGLKEDLHRCHFSLAQILRRRGNLSQALRHLDEAFACSEKLKDKQLQCETLLAKGQILLILDDYTGARVYLKKAFKLSTTNEQDKQDIKNFLKHATTLCRVEDSLVPLAEDDFNSRLPLYEKLGDTFTAVGNFKQALEYYHKTLMCAEKLSHSTSAKAPLYYSIAQTYVDLKLYNEAIEYFNKEMECRVGNYKEECKTLLNISDCELLQGEPYVKVNKILQSAVQKAKKARKPLLEMNCLKALYCAQENFQLTDEQATTMKVLEAMKAQYDISSDDESTSNCGSSQNTQSLQASDISDLSDSEDDVEEYGSPKRNASRNICKKNEKGETPLHRACIAGNLTHVKRLIEKGHPVNPRDNCGWLPLHEAANHDCYDIVEYLLDHGAWVNDRGGVLCDGIAPLHDAASCGNIKIMKLLIGRGASVVAKTNDGETPRDSLLKWMHRAGEDISRDFLSECRAMEARLKEMMEKLGHSVSINKDSMPLNDGETCNQESRLLSDDAYSDEDLTPPVTVVKKCQRKKRSAELLYSSEEEAASSRGREYKSRKKDNYELVSDEMLAPSQIIDSLSDSEEIYSVCSPKHADSFDVDESSQARQEYINAISSMRSATARLDEHSCASKPSEKVGMPALVDENAIVVDDWLVEDIDQPSTNVKKQGDIEAVFRASPRNVNKSALNHFISRQKSSSTNRSTTSKPKAKAKFRQTRLQPIAQVVDFGSTDVEVPQLALRPTASTFDENCGNIRNDSACVGAPLRVKVRVQDKLLLVPVPHNDMDQTVSWLSEEAASRYYSLSGLKPILRLSTIDGATLIHNDKLVDVINGNEEVLATVQQWDLPPLPERYVTACQSSNAVIYSNVKLALQSASDSRILVLDNFGLRPAMAAPLFRALKCQYGLRHFSVGGNCLGDEGIKALADSLSTLPNILTLNVSCNGITSLGLKALVGILENNEKNTNSAPTSPLELLNDLNLSYNNLGDSSSSVLGELVLRLPSLMCLKMSSCNITQQAFISNKSQLANGLKVATNLRSLDVGYNVLGVAGVGHLLKCVSANRITSLNLTSVIKDCAVSQSTPLGLSLKSYMMQVDCCLEELYLDDCSLNDECVCIFAVGLSCAHHLQVLSLAINPKLTVSSIGAITNSLKERKVGALDCLDMSGCLSVLSKVTTSRLLKLFPFWSAAEDQRQNFTLRLQWNFSRDIV